jgi:hypothetical protein
MRRNPRNSKWHREDSTTAIGLEYLVGRQRHVAVLLPPTSSSPKIINKQHRLLKHFKRLEFHGKSIVLLLIRVNRKKGSFTTFLTELTGA